MGMKKRNSKRIGTIVGVGVAVLLFLFVLAFSWICSCGIYRALCWCFGWEFSWGIATGLWICWCILRGLFNGLKNRD